MVADTLSRVEEIAILDQLDFVQVAQDQENDVELRELLKSDSALKLEKVTIGKTNTQIICDISTGNKRPYLPGPYRKKAFELIHGLAHPGAKASVKMVTAKYIWKSMRKDVTRWARGCLQCQTNKISRHVHSPIGQFPQTTQRFKDVHIDIVGPMTPSEGK